MAWCINAKNSLHNVHGFSPFQLVFGKNPRIPGILVDRPPALDSDTSACIVRENANAIHSARRAFIASESSEKIRRALRYNIRTSGDVKYYTGDKVYYKRLNSQQWKGPATVLGQDGQQVLVKHGGVYVRVHPCRLRFTKETIDEMDAVKQSSVTASPVSRVQSQNNDADVSVSDASPVSRVHSKNNNADVSSSDVSDNESDVESDADKSQEGFNDNVSQECSDVHGNLDDHHDVEDTQVSVPVVRTRRGRPPKVGNSKKTSSDTAKNLKKNMIIQYKLTGDDSWTTSKVISRSGKCTGKYANEWNMENQGGEKDIIDFNGNIEWREITDEHSNPLSAEDTGISDIADIAETRENPETEIVETFHVETLQDTLDAKYKELESWKKNDVYEEVDDEGQHCVSVRWVLLPKMIEGKLRTKARLCARGFEETLTFRTDSPTCMRESVRIVVIIIVSHMWILHSIDYKTAFLQGKQIDRVLYLRPPCESKTTKIWKLKKTVYGLADAPRVWFLRLKEELLKLGAKVSSYDQGIFFWHSTNGLEGIIICFVDDQLWGGSKWFEENVIEKLRQIFNIGCENSSAFKYIGIDLVQKSDFSVSVNQESYIKSIEPISLERSRQLQKDAVVTEKEKSKLRSLVGQLNWITGISRPDIGFGVCQLSSTIKNATVSHLVKANKILRNVKNSPNSIGFTKLFDLKNLKVVVYTDASFANLPNGGSQGGQIVFLGDKHNNSCPLAWKSNKIKSCEVNIGSRNLIVC